MSINCRFIVSLILHSLVVSCVGYTLFIVFLILLSFFFSPGCFVVIKFNTLYWSVFFTKRKFWIYKYIGKKMRAIPKVLYFHYCSVELFTTLVGFVIVFLKNKLHFLFVQNIIYIWNSRIVFSSLLKLQQLSLVQIAPKDFLTPELVLNIHV